MRSVRDKKRRQNDIDVKCHTSECIVNYPRQCRDSLTRDKERNGKKFSSNHYSTERNTDVSFGLFVNMSCQLKFPKHLNSKRTFPLLASLAQMSSYVRICSFFMYELCERERECKEFRTAICLILQHCGRVHTLSCSNDRCCK